MPGFSCVDLIQSDIVGHRWTILTGRGTQREFKFASCPAQRIAKLTVLPIKLLLDVLPHSEQSLGLPLAPSDPEASIGLDQVFRLIWSLESKISDQKSGVGPSDLEVRTC